MIKLLIENILRTHGRRKMLRQELKLNRQCSRELEEMFKMLGLDFEDIEVCDMCDEWE